MVYLVVKFLSEEIMDNLKKERILCTDMDLTGHETHGLFFTYLDKHYPNTAFTKVPPEVRRALYDVILWKGKLPTEHEVNKKVKSIRGIIERLDEIFKQKCALEREEAKLEGLF
jgi:hypothetical protein